MHVHIAQMHILFICMAINIVTMHEHNITTYHAHTLLPGSTCTAKYTKE